MSVTPATQKFATVLAEEMKRIPRGGRQSPQNFFRQSYRDLRNRIVTRHLSREEVLAMAVRATRASFPNYVFEWDEGFFGVRRGTA